MKLNSLLIRERKKISKGKSFDVPGRMRVAYSCNDSLNISWNRHNGATGKCYCNNIYTSLETIIKGWHVSADNYLAAEGSEKSVKPLYEIHNFAYFVKRIGFAFPYAYQS